MEHNKFSHLSREKKIAYLIWLDNVVLTLWGDYLDIWTDNSLTYNQKLNQTMDKKSLIDYFETLADELMKGISFREIKEFQKNNSNVCRNLSFDWSRLWI